MDTDIAEPRGASRSRSGRKQPEERPQWSLGASGGLPEILAGCCLVIIAMAALWLEPGFSRPLRHAPLVLSGLAGALAAYFLARDKLHSRSLLTFLFLAAWWSCSALSCWGSLDAFRSQQAMLNWTGGGCVFLLASLGFSSGKAWRTTVATLTVGAAIYCVGALVSKASQQPLTGTFTNRDTFSVIPMVCTFLALALARTSGRALPILAMTLSLCFAALTVLSGSRAGALGVLVGLAGWLGSLALHKDTKMFKQASRQATVGLLLIVGMGLPLGLVQPLLSRFGEAVNGKDIQGVTMRYDVVVHGLEASRHHPWLGSGPGTFALAYQEFRPQGVVADYMYVNYAHNDYMEMLVEVGWLGFLSWLLFASLVLIRGIRLIRFSIASWECSCLLAAVVSLGTFTTLNFILPVPAVFLWQMLILGLLQGLPSGPSPALQVSPLQKLMAVALGALGLGCSALSYANLQSALLVQKAQQLNEALRWEESIPILDKALGWQPLQLDALMERGTMLGKMGQFLHKPDLIKQGEASLDLASRISPREQNISSARIQLYSSLRNYAKAEELVLLAHRYAGYREWHIPTLIQLQSLQGNLEGAIRSVYAISLDDEKARETLPKLLVELEEHRPEAAVHLLQEWCSQEGEATVSFRLAKAAAHLAIENKKSEPAKRILVFITTQSPKDTEGLYLLSQALGMQGQKRARDAILEQLSARANGTKQDAYIDAALIDLAQGRDLQPLSPTLLSLEVRLKRFPKSTPLRLAVSQAYLDHGKPEEAAGIVSTALDAGNDNPDLLARMGTCLAKQGLEDLARQYYEQALKVNPKHGEATIGIKKLKPPAQ